MDSCVTQKFIVSGHSRFNFGVTDEVCLCFSFRNSIQTSTVVGSPPRTRITRPTISQRLNLLCSASRRPKLSASGTKLTVTTVEATLFFVCTPKRTFENVSSLCNHELFLLHWKCFNSCYVSSVCGWELMQVRRLHQWLMCVSLLCVCVCVDSWVRWRQVERLRSLEQFTLFSVWF